MRDNPITATIDFDKAGVQHGFLRLPHSTDASAWGSIMIPFTMARNGVGPTVLITGGNHGDEYEGPIALFDLAARINADELTGRVIIIPAMNYPAFRSGSRTSPIDGGNLNRTFPGHPKGGITAKIADYFQRSLLPLADFVIDLHSGGKSLDFVPFCAAHVLDDKALQDRCVDAMAAFNAPYSVMMREPDAAGMYDTAAEEMGKIFITTELGGGGTARPTTVALAKRGIGNVLRHAGIMPGAPEHSRTVRLEMPDHRCFVSSETTGLLDVCVELGAAVTKGQIVAHIYDAERTGVGPTSYYSPIDGIFIGRHVPGLISMGDMIAVIAVEI